MNVILFFFFSSLSWTNIRLFYCIEHTNNFVCTLCVLKPKTDKTVLSLTIVCFCIGLFFLSLYHFVSYLFLLPVYLYTKHIHLTLIHVLYLIFRPYLTYVMKLQKEKQYCHENERRNKCMIMVRAMILFPN